MRVVHVVPTPFGRGGLLGGGERYPLQLARALAGHVDCELVTFAADPAAAVEADGLRVRVLRRWALLRGHPAQPLAPQLLWVLRGADVVHTHQTRSAPSRLAAVAARVAGQHLVTTDHGLGGGGWGGLLPALFDRFLPVSEFARACNNLPAQRSRVVYGGADPAVFAPAPDETRRGVLFVGRITPHKGLDVLIRALPPGCPLTVAGSVGHDPRPPERDYPRLLRRLAADREVSFIGPVRDADLPGLYRRHRVFVLPSVSRTVYGRQVAISELLGLAALEAMASATPVVASRIGGLPEVVADEDTGFLVPPGDAAQLRDRLSRLLGDRRHAVRMGRRARERVLDRFTWQRCAQRCLDAYSELTALSAAA